MCPDDEHKFYEDYTLNEYIEGRLVAKEAVMSIFKLYSGQYDVGMFKSNVKAVTFWTNLMSSLNLAIDVEEGLIEIAGSIMPTIGLRFTISSEIDRYN